MMTFKEMVTGWNDGEWRGALARLSRESKVPPNYLSNYANGLYLPEGERLAAIAKALKMKPEEIVAAAKAGRAKRNQTAHLEIRESAAPYNALKQIPVLGVVHASRFSFSFDTFPEEHLPMFCPPGKDLFSLRISETNGDCLKGIDINPGDYVIMSRDAQPAEGKVVLAKFDGEWTLKILARDKKTGGLELRPDNPKYAPIPITSSKMTIEAVSVGTFRKF